MESFNTFCHQISDDPFVFAITSGWCFLSGLRYCDSLAQGNRYHALAAAYWDVRSALDVMAVDYAVAKTLHPRAEVTYLCHTQPEVEALRAIGVPALAIAINAFIDDAIFKPVAGVEKIYPAVINANLQAWKRHRLAWGIRGIAVITYDVVSSRNTAEIDGYQQPGFVNVDADGQPAWIEAEVTADKVRQSHCGLVLSALEGGNFASAEYLYCGVPLITTPSIGGRHTWYDPRYVTIVTPDAAAVEAAVERAVRTPCDPFAIHRSMVAKAIVHRLRLIDWLSAVCGRDLRAEASETAWLPHFRDKLRRGVYAEP